jgi:GNAT superfamily N-acetyltransferase
VTGAQRLSPDGFADAVPGLACLLADAVAGGASLGFLAPFGLDEAAGWWRSQEGAVADGSLVVWTCGAAERIDGTVSLSFDRTQNGRHRAHVGKLIVHRNARGRGLGRALLGTAERAAAAAGSTLLMLDTETGSPAEQLYRTAGWTCYGVVPRYAFNAGGALRDCSFFHKEVGEG